jgi:hypothetical protein
VGDIIPTFESAQELPFFIMNPQHLGAILAFSLGHISGLNPAYIRITEIAETVYACILVGWFQCPRDDATTEVGAVDVRVHRHVWRPKP